MSARKNGRTRGRHVSLGAPVLSCAYFFLSACYAGYSLSLAAFLSRHGALRDKTKRAAIRGYLDEMKLDSIVVFQEQL